MTSLLEDEATLLLVDDRPSNLTALEALLDPMGYRLLKATSGKEALRHLLNEEVAVILMDVQMPHMDGFETARHIKERERTRDIPILFLTAEAGEMEQAMRGFSSGAVDYLAKPIDEWLLRAKVQVFADLAVKTRLLQQQGNTLRQRLENQFASEARHLRQLADASIAINSSLSLSAMLEVINDSARDIIGARHADTVLTRTGEPQPSTLRTPLAGVEAIAQRQTAMSAIYELVWKRNGPVRMSKGEIQRVLTARGIQRIDAGHPRLQGWLAVPITGRTGRSLGLIEVADKVEGEFTTTDESVLTQLSQLAAVAIENAERYEQEHRIAEILQRSLLPTSLPTLPGIEFASYYQPGGGGTQIGGDWYDVFTLIDGRIALALGDVAGSGVRAAATMGQLRTALRAYAYRNPSPSDALGDVDRYVQHLDENAMATIALVILDLDKQSMEVISAGHPPPLIVSHDGTPRYLDIEADPPLGAVAEPKYTSLHQDLEPGSVILLYSDGLVEERTESLDLGLGRLAAAIDPTIENLDAFCRAIALSTAPDGKDDDVTILAVRFDL
jgi:serine phosphatase RsbU (regulator of sigma subunit)/CheY-like chemotaxis protein